MHALKRVERLGARIDEIRTAPLKLPLRLSVRAGQIVNDIHSQLNRTRVESILRPRSLESLQNIVRRARLTGQTISIAGGRHAMGGQQFGTDSVLLDLSEMNRIVRFDPERREVEVEAGIQWPELIDSLLEIQRGHQAPLGIIQKQTGADRLSIGGALAANIHGRGLSLKPFINDVESFVIVDAYGQARSCDRRENNELFRLAIGGYGLFGVIARVTLRLAPRQKLERVVRVENLRDLMQAFENRIAEGFMYGDFQFMTDSAAEGFLHQGIFSCYRPVPGDTPVAEDSKELHADDWRQLLYLAHTDRKRAFDMYAAHYLSTNGQIYWSDTHQLSVYLDDYHREVDARRRSSAPGSEMITEVYVPRERLVSFMETVRADFREHDAELIYGTIRLIERDDESFLAWAKERYACIVFNLHVTHDAAGLEKAKRDFRRLIDRAIQCGGSFYLTYHRWATREQLQRCYSQFQEFLLMKREFDPAEIFQSDWYRHHRAMFSAAKDAPIFADGGVTSLETAMKPSTNSH